MRRTWSELGEGGEELRAEIMGWILGWILGWIRGEGRVLVYMLLRDRTYIRSILHDKRLV